MAESAGNDTLTAFLESLGATGEQIEAARRDCTLARLPADLILRKDATLSAKDVATRAEVGVDQVVELWRTLGVSVPDDQRRMFSEQDASFTTVALQFEPVGTHADELFRVLGILSRGWRKRRSPSTSRPSSRRWTHPMRTF